MLVPEQLQGLPGLTLGDMLGRGGFGAVYLAAASISGAVETAGAQMIVGDSR